MNKTKKQKEEELLEKLAQSEKDFEEGRFKELKSLDDLMGD
ncbi:MAG: hypothetical protein PHY30_00790 [Candidatus Pacebacteria bacterium]|nr:hypothetical protein [Candidatus Paceibacterota bacterium]